MHPPLLAWGEIHLSWKQFIKQPPCCCCLFFRWCCYVILGGIEPVGWPERVRSWHRQGYWGAQPQELHYEPCVCPGCNGSRECYWWWWGFPGCRDKVRYPAPPEEKCKLKGFELYSYPAHQYATSADWQLWCVVGRLYSVQYKSIFCALDKVRRYTCVIRPDHWVRSEVLRLTPHLDMRWQRHHIITTSSPRCRTAFLRKGLVLDRPNTSDLMAISMDLFS